MKDHVLLIEDSRSFSALVEAHLQAAGHRVKACATVAETELALQSHPTRYFAAIVDLNLPDAPDGEAVDLVTRHNLPAIVFTSQINSDLRDAILSKGIADYSLKRGRHNLEYVTWMIGRLYRNRHINVLVVDDAKSSRELLQRLLSIQAFSVQTASNAADALQQLESEVEYKILIVDAIMDDMDGFELCSKVREKHSKKDLFILGVSAHNNNDISVKFIKSGANDFISKPFSPEEFFCRINQAAASIDMLSDLRASNEKKDLLLGMAAHDIRNPLSVMKRAGEKLRGKFEPKQREAELVNMIVNSSDRLLELLDTLLELSRVEDQNFALKLSDIKFSELLREILETHSSNASLKLIELHRSCSETLQIEADTVLIRQVIDNLISNAIKYSPQETRVDIIVSQDAEEVMFSVIDHGPGIRADEVNRLFQPFTRLSSKATAGESSTGLGLALCDRIISAHEGEIGYRPNPAGGSEFYFKIPNRAKV